MRLLEKFKAHGIGGKVLILWVEKWLTGRQQRVVINGQQSVWTDFPSGAPQGSVLGPTLLTIFNNDLDHDIRSDMLKFAGDVKLIGRVDSAEDVGRQRMDLTRLGSWAEKWRMMFNVEKCNVMNIGFKIEKKIIH